jgi:putative hydrolase of the HAD superfamily
MLMTDIRCLLFDLDDTLYSQDSGVWDMVRVRINQYLEEKMGFPLEQVGPLRQRLYQQYGTTLRGLQAEYAVDMDDYLDYVHDIPLETILQPDPQLNLVLNQLPQRKIIFTNASAAHARRVLQALAIESHFSKIVDIYAVKPFCKPDQEAFHKTLALINEPPENCLLIDDSHKNLETAQILGMSAVSIGRHRLDHTPNIDTILDLPLILNR